MKEENQIHKFSSIKEGCKKKHFPNVKTSWYMFSPAEDNLGIKSRLHS
jgi:hypothetical protein